MSYARAEMRGGNGAGPGGGRWDQDRFHRERERMERGGGRFVEERDHVDRGPGGRYFEERDYLEEDYGSQAAGGRDRDRDRDRFSRGDRLSAGTPRRRERSADDRFGSARARVELDRYGGGRERGRVEEDKFRGRLEEDRYSEGRGRFDDERGGRSRRESLYYEEDRGSMQESPGRSVVPFRSGGGAGGGRSRRQSNVMERGYGPPPPISARGPPARPGFIRRQSSLDTFDRRPMPRYGDHEDYREPPPIARPPPRIRRSPPRRYERDYEDIRIAEPDYYGDDEFREFREVRESGRGGREEPRRYTFRREAEEVEEQGEEQGEEELPFPRRGKTKMPSRLVERNAISVLGYPFEEEEGTIIILKALSGEQIDEVVRVSEELRKGASTYRVEESRMIEAPPSPPAEVYERKSEFISAPGPVPLKVIAQLTDSRSHAGTHKSEHGGKSEHGAKSEKSHRRRSKSHGGKSEHGGRSERVHRRRSKSHHSKSRRAESGSSSSSSSSSDTEVTKRKVVEDREESGTVRGPLQLVLPDRRKDEREIKEEIKALEREERALKHERKSRRHRGSSSGQYIEIEGGEGVKVERNRKEPDPRLVRAMLATLT